MKKMILNGKPNKWLSIHTIKGSTMRNASSLGNKTIYFT
jgi:hypothetical protein